MLRAASTPVAGSSAAASVVSAVAFAGLYRWSSPSPRKRAKPGSGSRSGPDGGRERPRLVEPLELDAGEVGGLEAARPRGRGGEAAGHDGGPELEGLEQLAADVARDGRDAHPGEHLAQAGVEGGEHVADGVVLGQLLRAAGARLLAGEGEQQARVHDAGPGGDDHREPVDVEHVPGVDHDVGPAAEAGLGEGGVHGSRGEDGRDGESCRVVERGGGIGQDEDLGPRTGGVERAGGESVERDLEPGIAAGGRPRRVEPAHGPVRRPGAVADRVEQPVEVDDDRASDPHGLGARGHPAQERRPAAELHLEVHDRPLALGVDRRVGDLRERLAEVVAGGTRDARPPGERRVVAHAPQRLVRVERHRPHVEAQLLGVQPEQVAQGGGRRGDALGRRSRGRVGRGVGRRLGNRDPGRALGVGEDLARGVVRAAGGAGPTTSRRRP